MPRFYAAAGRYFKAVSYSKQDFRSATDGASNLVFVSHKSDNADTKLAEEVAFVIQAKGLSAWVDTVDSELDGDGPEMLEYIENVISKSKALLAVVTENTRESWWVPCEITLAYTMSKLLASFGDEKLNPSFLAKWPNIPDDPPGSPIRNKGLEEWCKQVESWTPPYTQADYRRILRLHRASIYLASKGIH